MRDEALAAVTWFQIFSGIADRSGRPELAALKAHHARNIVVAMFGRLPSES